MTVNRGLDDLGFVAVIQRDPGKVNGNIGRYLRVLD